MHEINLQTGQGSTRTHEQKKILFIIYLMAVLPEVSDFFFQYNFINGSVTARAKLTFYLILEIVVIKLHRLE